MKPTCLLNTNTDEQNTLSGFHPGLTNNFVRMKRKLKINRLLILALVIPLFVASCSSDDDDEDVLGNWINRSDFDGAARGLSFSFSIGSKGYLGMGYNGKKRLNDFWEYNSDINSWTQLSDFPGVARTNAASFAIENKGYVGTGHDGENYLKDFWEYDPANNKWTQKADFAGSARYGAVGFGVDQKGYIGTGYDDNYLKDFYTYDPVANTWSLLLPSFSGKKRKDASVFIINNKVYLCCGNYSGTYVNDFWRFDPSASDDAKWTQLRDISNVSDDSYDDDYAIVRSNASAFSTSTNGYILLGTAGSSAYSDVWEYDPSTDLWAKKTGLEASARQDAASFSLNGRLFIATGKNSSYYMDDLLEFKPFDEYDEND
jgi:N-acetylneuraminic acid mutarotase